MAQASDSPSDTISIDTYSGFFAALLASLGIHGKQAIQDQYVLADVVKTEGPNVYYNPFNIEWHSGEDTAYKGIASHNSVGVQEYANVQQGLTATRAFLLDNPHWDSFVSALKTGSASDVQNALSNAYTWANLKTASHNEAGGILASKIGTGSATITSSDWLDKFGNGLSDVAGSLTGGLIGNLPGGVNLNRPGTPTIGQDVKGAVKGGVDAVMSVPKFLGWLKDEVTSETTWIRIGLAVLGLIVLVVAINKLSGGKVSDTIGSVASAAPMLAE